MKKDDFHAFFQNFINSWASIIFLKMNREGVIQEANAFAQELAGKDLRGQALKEFLVLFASDFHINELAKDPNKKHLFNINTFSKLPQTYYFNFLDAGKTIYGFGNLDAKEVEGLRSQLMDANNELNALTRQLHKKNVELQKLNNLKNQFLGMAVHDLRKPLGIILSFSEFLIDEAAPRLNEEHRQFLDTILDSTLSMKHLADDFLDVTAIEAGKLPVDLRPGALSKVIDNSLRLNMAMARKQQVTLKLSKEKDVPPISMDSEKIEQVLTNLVSNAIEHSRAHSEVDILVQSSAGLVTISVTDRGIGISSEKMKTLFKPFEGTGKKRDAGDRSAGLGLIIARKIAEAQGSRLEVDSIPDKGTTVRFSLPIHS